MKGAQHDPHPLSQGKDYGGLGKEVVVLVVLLLMVAEL